MRIWALSVETCYWEYKLVYPFLRVLVDQYAYDEFDYNYTNVRMIPVLMYCNRHYSKAWPVCVRAYLRVKAHIVRASY